MVLGVHCDLDIFKLTGSAQSINWEVYVMMYLSFVALYFTKHDLSSKTLHCILQLRVLDGWPQLSPESRSERRRDRLQSAEGRPGQFVRARRTEQGTVQQRRLRAAHGGRYHLPTDLQIQGALSYWLWPQVCTPLLETTARGLVTYSCKPIMKKKTFLARIHIHNLWCNKTSNEVRFQISIERWFI